MGILSNITDIFWSWTTRKIEHHLQENNKQIFFHEKEIWWAALGQNIGFEINGKSNQFSRPVLILRKYSSEMCFVLPLTTQIKRESPAYQFIVEVNGVRSAVSLSQGRTISSKRLISKMNKVSAIIFQEIVSSFVNYLTKK